MGPVVARASPSRGATACALANTNTASPTPRRPRRRAEQQPAGHTPASLTPRAGSPGANTPRRRPVRHNSSRAGQHPANSPTRGATSNSPHAASRRRPTPPPRRRPRGATARAPANTPASPMPRAEQQPARRPTRPPRRWASTVSSTSTRSTRPRPPWAPRPHRMNTAFRACRINVGDWHRSATRPIVHGSIGAGRPSRPGRTVARWPAGLRPRGLARRGVQAGSGPRMRGGAISRLSRKFVSISSRIWLFSRRPFEFWPVWGSSAACA